MFTGLIEEKGRVKEAVLSSDGMKLTVSCSKILEDARLGASISINGACQTIIDYGADYITVQASNETLKITNYKNLKTGDAVNLERALTLNKRIDGHIVSGHIDCAAEFINRHKDGFSERFFFKLPEDFAKYVIYKGSIAVNGISLTIASIENNIFSIEVIPLTLKETNLSELKKGDFVNIETDLFAKYAEKIVKSKKEAGINYDFLAENGFI